MKHRERSTVQQNLVILNSRIPMNSQSFENQKINLDHTTETERSTDNINKKD